MSKQKILITGFPHTGTSILKAKMGECKNLYEVPKEYFNVLPNDLFLAKDKKFVLVKSPVIPIEIRANNLEYLIKAKKEYSDYVLIFVIRNPWNVFTSVIKAGYNPLTKNGPNSTFDYHMSIGEYEAAGKIFLNAKEKNYPNVYAIRYEDFFVNDFTNLKNLFNSIGLEFDDTIFYQKSKNYTHVPGFNFDNIKENPTYKDGQIIVRTWQINQPFQNMNGDVDIPDELSDILENSPIIKELGYTDPRKIK
jgi:hypothetical protein